MGLKIVDKTEYCRCGPETDPLCLGWRLELIGQGSKDISGGIYGD